MNMSRLNYLGVQVAQSLNVTKVTGGVFISGLESSVVVADDGIKQISECAVRFGIRSVDTDSRVQVLHACYSKQVNLPTSQQKS